VVTYRDGEWGCDCETIAQAGYCSHTMTMERVLGDMVQRHQSDGNGA
jgi:hypothetical protein